MQHNQQKKKSIIKERKQNAFKMKHEQIHFFLYAIHYTAIY